MADRTSAGLFGDIFEYLAKQDQDHTEFVNFLWSLTSDYDFNKYQMFCDKSLIKLGLAREYLDPDYGEIIIYKGDERWET